MHRQVALHQHGHEVLEIGAGTLNHLPYEPADLVYDAVEPFEDLWKGRPGLSRLRRMYRSITEVPTDARYDRVFSVAVLEHLTELPRIIAEAALRLRSGGVFQAGIPTEGGFLWGLAWRLSTGISFRLRTGLSYSQIMRHEHVNCAREIVVVCRWLFDEIEIDRFPLSTQHLSFYTVLEGRGPRLARCRKLIGE